jgi:hypothetical protein
MLERDEPLDALKKLIKFLDFNSHGHKICPQFPIPLTMFDSLLETTGSLLILLFHKQAISQISPSIRLCHININTLGK